MKHNVDAVNLVTTLLSSKEKGKREEYDKLKTETIQIITAWANALIKIHNDSKKLRIRETHEVTEEVKEVKLCIKIHPDSIQLELLSKNNRTSRSTHGLLLGLTYPNKSRIIITGSSERTIKHSLIVVGKDGKLILAQNQDFIQPYIKLGQISPDEQQITDFKEIIAALGSPLKDTDEDYVTQRIFELFQKQLEA